MSDFTPGPWIVDPHERLGLERDEIAVKQHNIAGAVVCGVWPQGDDSEEDEDGVPLNVALANARLIANAPELFGVVCQMLAQMKTLVARVAADEFELAAMADAEQVIFQIGGCDACENTGIRPYCSNGKGLTPPEGFVIVERCDACAVYEDDLEAAKVWGDDAQWQPGVLTEGQAIARPIGGRVRLSLPHEYQYTDFSATVK